MQEQQITQTTNNQKPKIQTTTNNQQRPKTQTTIPRELGISHYEAVKNMRELFKKCLPNSGIAEIIACANGRYVSDEHRE